MLARVGTQNDYGEEQEALRRTKSGDEEKGLDKAGEGAVKDGREAEEPWTYPDGGWRAWSVVFVRQESVAALSVATPILTPTIASAGLFLLRFVPDGLCECVILVLLRFYLLAASCPDLAQLLHTLR